MMGISAGPDMVQDGLVLTLNASDRLSYISGSTTWNDVSGQGNNALLINGPTFNSSNGGSIVFDGSNDYGNVNSLANVLSNSAYTKIAWFRPTSFSTNNNIISGDVSGMHAFWLAGGNKLNAGHNGSWSTVVSTTTLALNTWYFGAVTFNTTNGWVLYLNGVRESTSSNTTTFTGTGKILIGAYVLADNLFTGRISFAQVYNRVLSDVEIQQNYNALKSRFNL
jgi:hypothetical protein